MNQEEINSLIKSPRIQEVISSEEFYFQKGQDALKKWLEMDVDIELKESLIKFSTDYNQFLEIAELEPNFEKIKRLLFEIISYCDDKARDKNLYNQYENKRILANASVRMNNWVEGLIKLKFKNDKIKGVSIINAFNYLLSPQDNSTILSRNHREMIAENLLEKSFSSEQFVRELQDYFEQFNLSVKNRDNYTYLLSCIIYSIKNKWQDDVVGLIASDNTGWQESELILDKQWDGLILWNSKKPTKGAKVLKFLKDKIEDTGFFPLYYSVKGEVVYCANIIDYATTQEELDNIHSQNKALKHFRSDFSEYRDDKKSARIVFVAEGIEKIMPIPTSEFEFYKSYPPRQDNLSPIKTLPEDQISTTQQNSDKMANELNQILFGPPGTGKTFYLQNKYFPRYTTTEDSITADQHFTQLVQSLSWWQVLGIALLEENNLKVSDLHLNRWVNKKAELSESKNVRATIWGTLQMHTVNESSTVNYKQRQAPLIFDKNTDKSWQIFEEEAKEIAPELFEHLDSVNNFKPSPNKTVKRYEFVTFHQSYTYEDFVEGIKPVIIEDIDEQNDLKYEIKSGIFKEICKRAENDPNNDYALFIDEINRGNVSQIFGELITLIEQDKRKGEENELSLILPYSRKLFGVPKNLHIIGTMNTADRSVEALDTALRRRFSFTEMPPKPELIKTEGKAENGIVNGIDLSVLLETINKRIEKLLDKDHMIGHSYFLSVESLKGLKSAFQNKIVPLLQEYFFGDYGKIGLVLGNGFVEIMDNSEIDVFANFEYDNPPLEKKVYHIQNIESNEFDIVKAINQLMKPSTS